LEAKSKWTDKKEKELYSETVENAEVPATLIVRPMLAQTFNLEKKCAFPVYVQRKYDGIRCVAHLEDCSVILESRNGVPFSNFDVLREQLLPILQENPALYLDGELYTNEIPFETLSGYVRCKKNLTPSDIDEINKIQYHIYDFYSVENPKETYQNRLNMLTELFQKIPIDSLIKEVKTDIANNHTDIQQFHADYVANGFEGIMIRSTNGLYELDKRSKYLHKYKEFMEEEFEIVGYHQGDAGEKGCVVWDCVRHFESNVNSDGKTFAVRPRGTFEQRKEWFLEGDSYVGKKITVIFQEYSQDGIPRFPVGKSIRIDY
jgi:DNA ligase-1